MRTIRLSLLPAVDTRDLLRVALDLSGTINAKAWLEADEGTVWMHAPLSVMFSGINWSQGIPWVEADFYSPDPTLLSCGAYQAKDWEVLRQFLVLPLWPAAESKIKACTCPMPVLLAQGCQCGGI